MTYKHPKSPTTHNTHHRLLKHTCYATQHSVCTGYRWWEWLWIWM